MAINCPKCQAEAAESATECPRCGIVFAKFEQRAAFAPVPPEASATIDATPPTAPRPSLSVVQIGRSAVVVGLIVWTWQFARVPMGMAASSSMLHLPNLIFHEAGHVLFAPFGRFMTVLGGSLFQFALPLESRSRFSNRTIPSARQSAPGGQERTCWMSHRTSPTPARCSWCCLEARPAPKFKDTIGSIFWPPLGGCVSIGRWDCGPTVSVS